MDGACSSSIRNSGISLGRAPIKLSPMATHIADTESAVTGTSWTIDAARALYNIEGWGAGFFDINDRGHIIVRPDRDRPDHVVDLYEVTNDLEEQGIALPV